MKLPWIIKPPICVPDVFGHKNSLYGGVTDKDNLAVEGMKDEQKSAESG